MNKIEFKHLIDLEVYSPYIKSKGKITLFEKIWCKYFSPEGNAVYLLRKKQYLESGNTFARLRSRFVHGKLMRKYGIHVDEGCIIGEGLRIAHPTSIVITKCTIGVNFQIYQNCTIGQKFHGSNLTPVIGDNVIMYAGSMIVGDVKVCDNVRLGANSLLLTDASEEGDYIGSPAKKKVR